MKRIALFTASFLLCSMAFAGPVTQDEAQKRAAQFMASRQQGIGVKTIRLTKRKPSTQSSFVQAEMTDAASYYVFNIDADGGFVIVSGDDRTPSILGYADNGHFDADNIPDNMREWLKGYEEQMKWLDYQSEETTVQLPPLTTNPSALTSQPSSLKRAPSVRHSVPPLLTTIWDQNDPYNRLLIDTSKSSDVCYTGCVATAMAQLMNYHGQQTGQPEKTTTAIAAYKTASRQYSVLGVNKGTAINWADMLDSYTVGMTTETDEERRQVEAVAQLMHFCGASVNMDYGTKSSGADMTITPMVLKKYFGYDQATRNAIRGQYSSTRWNELIYAELAEQRPVVMGGQSSGGGHAFIVDGYDGDELFHINWGWGGHCNGYYLLTIANPTDKQGIGAGNSADGYSMSQYAVIGAQPDTGVPYDAGGLMMDFNEITVSQGNVIFSAFNQNEKTTAFDVGIGYFQDNGSIMAIKYADTGSLPQHYGYRGMEFEVKLPKMDGTVYKVAVICREAGTTKWLTPMNTTDYYIEATGKQSGATLNIVKPQPALKVENIRFDSALRAMREHEANITISNSGDEFYGKLHFTTRSMDNSDKDSCSVGVTVLKGQTQAVQFPFKPAKSGKYEITVSTDTDVQGVIYTSTIDVGNPAPTSKDVNLSIDINIANLNSRGNAILGNKAKVVINVTNDTDIDYEGMFVVLLIEPGTFRYSPVIKHFESHSKEVIEQEFDVVQGNSYIPLCITDIPGRTQITQNPTVLYEVAPAVTIYMADGTHHTIEAETVVNVPDSAVAVDLMGNSTTKTVNASSNPNCLYYFSEDADTPEGLSANVVKGSQAESLTLTDNGLPFMPILTFTASTAAYTHSFDSGLKVMGTTLQPSWTTICLPFDVQTCTLANNTKVNWMHRKSNDKYDFWLMEFLGDEKDSLYFAPAEKMLANTPYLIMVPGAGLKDLHNMTDTPVTFHGSDTEIKAGAKGIAASKKYKFVGTTEEVTDNEKAYKIATDGSECTRSSVHVQPFQAYVKAMSNATPLSRVPISIAATISAEAGTEQIIKGDVNGDGAVDVADISAVITVMAGSAREKEKAADVNGDGTVDVADISAIIAIMAN